jgi:predicted ABC-class ATPase
MKSSDDLRHTLHRIDGRGYRAYKDIAGGYELGHVHLWVDHVQGDPFAAPSRIRVELSGRVAGFPPDLLERNIRRIALQDFLVRRFDDAIGDAGGRRSGSGHSGEIRIDRGGQQVIERTAMRVTAGTVAARFTVGLPANGRTVLGRQAETILLHEIPAIVSRSLLFSALDEPELRRFVNSIEDQQALRDQLAKHGLVAFIANGALLPRRSGIDDRPAAGTGGEPVVPWVSPAELLCSLDTPNGGRVDGTGIPAGVLLIAGGGFHGKSTLLQAIERGVYNHLPGDGRERVVTVAAAAKIRAEDGRRVEKVNIEPFISNLPRDRDTVRFSTDNASGSTSQAANIIEAIEAGATLLLIDEDTAATNFMVRDGRMQRLVDKPREPITPFVDRVGQLRREHDVSTILVMGGCGDYFEVADRVILMDAYVPADATGTARDIAGQFSTGRTIEATHRFPGTTPRRPRGISFDARRGRRDVRIDAQGLRTIRFGRTTIDLSALDQLVDGSQTRAIGAALHLLAVEMFDGETTLRQGLERLFALLDQDGLDRLDPRLVGNLAMPRPLEVAAAINRLRTLQVN